MAYTVSEIDAIIAKLESRLGQGEAEVIFEGRTIRYKDDNAINKAIAYFGAKYATATDAENRPKRVRTYYPVANNGFGSF